MGFSWNFILAVLMAFLLVQAAQLRNIPIKRDARVKIRNCGPPDKTFQFKIPPWVPGDEINITVTFTPVVDVLSAMFVYEIYFDGTLVFKGSDDRCSLVPGLGVCGLQANKTYTFTKTNVAIFPSPPQLGDYRLKAQLFNQDWQMYYCVEVFYNNE